MVVHMCPHKIADADVCLFRPCLWNSGCFWSGRSMYELPTASRSLCEIFAVPVDDFPCEIKHFAPSQLQKEGSVDRYNAQKFLSRI